MKKSGLLAALGLAAVSTTGDGLWFILPALVGLAMILGGVRLYEKNR